MRKDIGACALLLVWAVSGSAGAQTYSGQTAWVEPYEEYGKHVEAARRVAPLGSDLFGEQVSLYNGSTEFSVVDVSIPGNNALPVEFRRRNKIENREGSRPIGGMGNWEIDVPHLYGNFPDGGWIVGGGGGSNRCSNVQAPAPASAYFTLQEQWSGNYLHIPGGGDSEILATQGGGELPAVADGYSYPWITEGKWRLRCTTMLSANGFSGQGFIAVSPDGTEYTFNHGFQETGQPIGKGMSPGLYYTRKHVWIFATKIEDRFGNVVNLAYSGKRLTSVSSPDGRSITINYNTMSPTPQVSSVVADGKTWIYGYGTQYQGAWGYPLTSVTRPDGSAWQYAYPNGSQPVGSYTSLVVEGEQPDCPPSLMDGPTLHVIEITHPAGAKGRFELLYDRHIRSGTPVGCTVRAPGDHYETYPHYFDNFSLVKKTITGPGLPSMVWQYDYQNGYPPDFTYAPGYCPGCDTRKKVVVTQPDGSKHISEFGISFGVNEGLLMGTEVRNTAGTVLTSAANRYLAIGEDVNHPFPARYGASLRSLEPAHAYLRPLIESVTTQQGVRFETLNETFDLFANPTRVRRRSVNVSTGTDRASRTESLSYHHNYVHWVIGQVSAVGLLAPENGTQLARVEFDALARPYKLYGMASAGVTEQLEQELTFHAVGSSTPGAVHTVKDGRTLTTTLTDWYRGVPRSIQFADMKTRSATVSPLGWITSTTDENGYATSYSHDAMGRITQVTYPAGDSVAWAPTTINHSQIWTGEYGLPPGHWRQVITTGNGQTVIYFDALMRPRVQAEYDTSSISATLRFTVKDFDHNGRETFAAYPVSTLVNFWDANRGVWSAYDALGRITAVSQDSEQGLLTTTTEYQNPFQTLTVNPRGFQTVTQFHVFDQPSMEWPGGITQLAGAATEIYRDSLGRTTHIKRRNLSGSVQQSRYYVYDAHGRLCKTVEPETGATVLGYDDAGNLAWSASGLNRPDTAQASCDTDRNFAYYSSGRRVDRTYDARNRLATLVFPDGNGNQTWTYTPDGLPASVTTLNDQGSTSVINGYTYNFRRMLVGESSSQPGWYTWSVGYGYNANGHLASQTYPSTLAVTFAPNGLGQATQVGYYATGVQYHPNGAVKQFTYGNGLMHTMVQNARMLPASSVDTGGAVNHEYGYDANGNVLATFDHNNSTRSRWMAYDGLDRLTDAGSVVFGGDHWHRYTYDALDNLESWKLAGVKDYADYVYDATNRLTAIRNSGGAALHTLSYDPQGNLASKDGAGYYFDYGNRLRSVSSPTAYESYRYDAHGRRVLAWTGAGSKLTMYGNTGQIAYIHNEPKGQSEEHYYLAGSLVAIREWKFSGATIVKYQHTDALGSPVTVSDEYGVVGPDDRTDYDPYGGAISKFPPVDGAGYTGHVMDPVTGLTYMQQRYYDPNLGRFLSVDPVAASTGPGFNRYSYANNNPYFYVDPDGRQACGSLDNCVEATNFDSMRAPPQTVTQSGAVDAAAVAGMPNYESMGNTENGVRFDEDASGNVSTTQVPTTSVVNGNVIQSTISGIAGADSVGHSHPIDTSEPSPGPGDDAAVNAGFPNNIGHDGNVIVVEMVEGQFRARVLNDADLTPADRTEIQRDVNQFQRRVQ